MIFGTDHFFFNHGVRWQTCYCSARRPNSPFPFLVRVFADADNRYEVEPNENYDSRIVGEGKEIMVLMYPKGSVVILEETPK
jgi:hypothetical protein